MVNFVWARSAFQTVKIEKLHVFYSYLQHFFKLIHNQYTMSVESSNSKISGIHSLQSRTALYYTQSGYPNSCIHIIDCAEDIASSLGGVSLLVLHIHFFSRIQIISARIMKCKCMMSTTINRLDLDPTFTRSIAQETAASL